MVFPLWRKATFLEVHWTDFFFFFLIFIDLFDWILVVAYELLVLTCEI